MSKDFKNYLKLSNRLQERLKKYEPIIYKEVENILTKCRKYVKNMLNRYCQKDVEICQIFCEFYLNLKDFPDIFR